MPWLSHAEGVGLKEWLGAPEKSASQIRNAALKGGWKETENKDATYYGSKECNNSVTSMDSPVDRSVTKSNGPTLLGVERNAGKPKQDADE